MQHSHIDTLAKHGVHVEAENETQYVCSCSCPAAHGKTRRFYARKDKPLWDCKLCGKMGNVEQYLALRATDYAKALTPMVSRKLWKDRGIKPSTFQAFGVGFSGVHFTIPMDGNPKRKVVNIKMYRPGSRSMATKGCTLSLIAPKVMHNSERVYLCEGEWDAMACFEALQLAGLDHDVLSCPGASALPKESLDLFIGKDVVLLFDNDEPGQVGAFKAFHKLSGIANRVAHVRWPQGLKEGYDFRDFYLESTNRKKVMENIARLFVVGPPDLPDEVRNKIKIPHATGKAGRAVVYSGKGLSHRKVEERYRRWLHMQQTEPLDIMFGTMFANRLEGDPLWVFMVAPPGGMKTELLISLSDAPGVVTTTSLTPHSLISGANFTGGDPSLIPQLNGKVLIIKDFTTILKMNTIARDEIFGILRDAYDGKTEKYFGNGVVRSYESKFGILAGVTPAIESMSAGSTVMGERFLKYKMGSTGKLSTGKDAIMRALNNLPQNDQMRKELLDCGKETLDRDVSAQGYPELSEELKHRIAGLAQWIAMLRGVVDRDKYTRTLNFKPMAEIGTRLAKQLCKLSYGVAIYRQEEEVTEDTYLTVLKVAQGTAPDRVEELIKRLYVHSEKPGDEFSTKDAAAWSHLPEDTARVLLQDLDLLSVVKRSGKRRGYWSLERGMFNLMRSLRMYEQERKWLRGNQAHNTKSKSKPKPIRRTR